MEILILGSKGLLGAEMTRLAREAGNAVTALDREDLDISNEFAVRDVCESVPFEVVVNCAVIQPTQCEREPEAARAVNVEGVRYLLKYKWPSARLVHFSSPAVFDALPPLKSVHDYCFDAHVGYKESDTISAASVYGKTKAEAERLLRHTDSLILRVSWLYSKEKPFGLARTDHFACNEIGRPTYTEDVWKCLRIFLQEKFAGTFHVCGPEIMSRYVQAKILGRDPKEFFLPQDNIRPLGISKTVQLLKKRDVSLTALEAFFNV